MLQACAKEMIVITRKKWPHAISGTPHQISRRTMCITQFSAMRPQIGMRYGVGKTANRQRSANERFAGFCGSSASVTASSGLVEAAEARARSEDPSDAMFSSERLNLRVAVGHRRSMQAVQDAP